MLAEILAAARALPQLVKVAERIADGVQALNKAQQEKVAKERRDKKDSIVNDFISDGVHSDPEVQRSSGAAGEPPEGSS
tara:strand:- start:2922 stop:3158 length:237 start_codon:yes stop_codon:yes gene_type:complete